MEGERRQLESGAGLEPFSVKSSHSLLVLGGVDEDVENAVATMLDEFMLLAHDDPIWRENACKKRRVDAEGACGEIGLLAGRHGCSAS